MSLFRSEEHLDKWLHGRPRGALASVEQIWKLAKAWYVDPRASDWRPRPRDASQAVINAAGLTGDFWALP